ncbi:acyl-CoA dehydrogenase [Arthrobacter sp. zg-Y1219]|uniref:acyl-CoA dehydrogenase n=1 Tax=Arthrobacter sp. zg-Y1219 TaxID=3049067 RepID=UPI0024C3A360|nr:acyl-CoA dehydrogenase [Arthrobacter sp. zg-Y1219]MDK1360592.1 acyl-CoA dehydrogenase [Arthrobacter sp. zg-Y1219]
MDTFSLPEADFGAQEVPGLPELSQRAAAVRGCASAGLTLAEELAAAAPYPGQGRTKRLWSILATVAAADLTAARSVEPHLDALAILEQAGTSADPGTWGVFAAEGPGTELTATPVAGGWELSGRKPWCSLASSLDHAVVTAHTGAGRRRAFAVDLRQAAVTPVPGTWISRGLADVDSGPVDFASAAARPVGDDNWYLRRPGFAWGGIGVAACWYGGAAGVARRMFSAAQEREPDQIAHLLLGRADARLQAARAALDSAAAAVDAGRAEGRDGALLAQRVRGIVADAAAEVLTLADHGLGPGPLALEEDHARRTADLRIYLRQHHAERDFAALGRSLLQGGGAPW